MKIQLVSDLHLEFDRDFRLYNTGNAQVLVIAGDAFVADYITRGSDSPYAPVVNSAKGFFKTAAQEYPYVIYIMGNHEHYYGLYSETSSIMREFLAEFSNIIVLDNETIKIDNTTFIGSTLWTSCDNKNTNVMAYLSNYLNDYRIITYSKEPFSKFYPALTAKEFSKNLAFIENAIINAETPNKVVITHHAPSRRSVNPKYKFETTGNHGYYSDLDLFIRDNPVNLWLHGHMHDCVDYSIGDTRIVCNPKGYRNENRYFNKELILETNSSGF